MFIFSWFSWQNSNEWFRQTTSFHTCWWWTRHTRSILRFIDFLLTWFKSTYFTKFKFTKNSIHKSSTWIKSGWKSLKNVSYFHFVFIFLGVSAICLPNFKMSAVCLHIFRMPKSWNETFLWFSNSMKCGSCRYFYGPPFFRISY